jgi:hypothetical protein
MLQSQAGFRGNYGQSVRIYHMGDIGVLGQEPAVRTVGRMHIITIRYTPHRGVLSLCVLSS